jgi:hypothetical protein
VDELTLLREFRDTAPSGAPSALRQRALGVGPRRTTSRRPALRLAVAAALVATGGGLAATALVPPGPSEAAAVLGDAARLLAQQPDPATPGPLQWIYVKALHADPVTGQPGTHPGESWIRFDGAKAGERRPDGVHVQDLVGWPLGTPQQQYDVLASLPDSPDAVLQHLRDDPLYESKGASQADRDFDEVTNALTAETFISPQDRARLYLALARIPGVGIDDEAAPDLVGRRVLSVTYTGDLSLGREGDLWELLLDPETYEVRGLRGTAGEDFELGKGEGGGEFVPQGTTWYQVAILDQRLVDSVGQTR